VEAPSGEPIERLGAQARAELQQGNYLAAQARLDEMRALQADHPLVLDLQDRLATAAPTTAVAPTPTDMTHQASTSASLAHEAPAPLPPTLVAKPLLPDPTELAEVQRLCDGIPTIPEPGCAGVCYQGQEYRGRPHGEGTKRYASGNLYAGQWEYGQKSGRGTMVLHSSGQQYHGDWQGGRRNGLGIMLFPSGNCFYGHWKDDLREGPGVFVYADGGILPGTWRQDRLRPVTR
jgi:Uncharacterized protein conserved in bacteria